MQNENKQLNPSNPKSLDDIIQAFADVFVLGDKGFIKVIMATILGTQLSEIPVWLMFVAASSGGKTAFIDSILGATLLNGKKLTHPISDITTNTFISGIRRSGDGQNSFLHTMQDGSFMVFKDFTSILSMQNDARTSVLSQLREIYDGAFMKRTGNGTETEIKGWTGKLGAIGACTETYYQHMGSTLATMGDRFIVYGVTTPNRRKATLRAMRNTGKEKVLQEDLKNNVSAYIEYFFKNFQSVDMTKFENTLNDENSKEFDDILTIADICTKMRSGIFTNERTGKIDFVPGVELPMRVAKQLTVILKALYILRKLDPLDTSTEIITKEEKQIITKIAFSSIPVKRRMALRYLCQYKKGMNSSGISSLVGYETSVVKKWLNELMGLGIVVKTMSNRHELIWKLKSEYVDIIARYEKVKPLNEEYLGKADINEMNEEGQIVF